MPVVTNLLANALRNGGGDHFRITFRRGDAVIQAGGANPDMGLPESTASKWQGGPAQRLRRQAGGLTGYR